MKISCRPHPGKAAMTLLELTVVIMVLLALTALGMAGSNQYRAWRLGRAAAESLRSVYAAQRLFLADNPTTAVADITEAQIIAYLPNVANPPPATLALALAPVTSLNNINLTYNFNVVPPQLREGAAVVAYDPSGSPTDSLWDTGP